jgi:L-serine dehydratase
VTESISILNEVLGPVMRGPSSSHTAGAYHIGRLARSLLGDDVASARIAFDPGGSFAQVYRQQRSDLGLAAGLMDWPITDECFADALGVAAAEGRSISFAVAPLSENDHPNVVRLDLVGRAGRTLQLLARSVGGGSVIVTEIAGWPVRLTGDAHDVLFLATNEQVGQVRSRLDDSATLLAPATEVTREGQTLLHFRRRSALPAGLIHDLSTLPGVVDHWAAAPVFWVRAGRPLWTSGGEMVQLARGCGCTLGEAALAYEAALLHQPEERVLEEIWHRHQVMERSVAAGLADPDPGLQLLHPSARQVFRAEAEGAVAIGGLHTRAAARAMAVMHHNSVGGVVCAAPTAGSAGTLPAVLATLHEEQGLGRRELTLALLAAGAVGLVVAMRATFAAEVAGCQVEIGAAGAMAAAAVVEAAGGTAAQAADAAAIAFQNTMGSVCDLVQGVVEIPCHTRNAVAASSAFVCADLILGGYRNPIPLDETVDAVYAVGRMLPRELRCTALGGLAQAPSALALRRRTEG